jgi:glycosyltransferase involved in cell wall biosynthesis
MKILFALDTLVNAGAEKSTLDILSQFTKDTEVKVVYFYPGYDLKADFEKAGIPLHFVDLKGKRSFIKGISRLIKLIREEKPDLVISSIMRADLISRIAGYITGTTVIGTLVNDSYGQIRIDELRSQKLYSKFRFFWLLDKWTSWIPAYWISNAVSIAKSNALAMGIKKKRIKVIYRGRNTGIFPEWKPLPLNDKFRFVFVGRLMERKGLEELITAFSIVKEKYENVQLDIFGEGVFRKRLQESIQQLHLQDTVILHGAVPNGWKKLYEAHAFVFPSWYEGFSGSLIEAMITGIPIIASDIPMNLEAVSNQTALIFKVKDVNQLAANMERMITSYPEMTEMGKRAKQLATGRFDIKVIANQYETFLNAVVNKTVNEESLM